MKATLSLRLEDELAMVDSTMLELSLTVGADAFQDTLKRLIAQQMPEALPAVFELHEVKSHEVLEARDRPAELESSAGSQEPAEAEPEA